MVDTLDREFDDLTVTTTPHLMWSEPEIPYTRGKNTTAPPHMQSAHQRVTWWNLNGAGARILTVTRDRNGRFFLRSHF